jgi:hypothetical protein
VPTIPLTPEQEAEAQRLFHVLKKKFLDEAEQMARLLASKDDAHLLGATEFELRDHVLRLGAQTLQAALDERKKGGTKGRVPTAPSAATRSSASAGAAKPSSP